MRRHRQQMEPLTEINVTNLLDTAFVLLMAFMIVAPSIKHGIELTIPTVGGSNMETPKPVTVVIEKKKAESQQEEWIYIDDRVMTSLDQLRDTLIEKRKATPELDVVLEVDQEVSYARFMEALGAIKALGIEKVGLMTTPPEKPAAKEPKKRN